MPDEAEPRFRVELPVRVFGMDADNHPFSLKVLTQDISDRGAKLCGVEKQLRPGDIIGVQSGEKKARCKVIWTGDTGTEQKFEAGVRTVDGQTCPWQKEMGEQRSQGAVPILRVVPLPKDKRTFPRRRIAFQIEIRDARGAGAPMRTNTADMAGGGCYVETLLPFPVKTSLDVTFWMNSERVHTTAIVRTCDGGVGMGIEFTGLDEAARARLQQHVEELAGQAAPFPERAGGVVPAALSAAAKI